MRGEIRVPGVGVRFTLPIFSGSKREKTGRPVRPRLGKQAKVGAMAFRRDKRATGVTTAAEGLLFPHAPGLAQIRFHPRDPDEAGTTAYAPRTGWTAPDLPLLAGAHTGPCNRYGAR
ncbi:hypothetical protein ACFSC1_00260 [Paracoccus aurantiacus]|uniref:hypothetical protein n=1 Tax=Paracoccus aurantiacus TaxID=2599412 RepID=UPI0011BD892A|nr:hypothetical protein [Paracoccus aurantiacus]